MEIIKWANGKGETLRLTVEEKRKLVKALQEATYLRTVTITLDTGKTEIEIG